MATFIAMETVKRVIQYTVPAPLNVGAASAEIGKAWAAAERHYRSVYHIPDDKALADNALNFFVGDDQVIIQFEVEDNDANKDIEQIQWETRTEFAEKLLQFIRRNATKGEIADPSRDVIYADNLADWAEQVGLGGLPEDTLTPPQDMGQTQVIPVIKS